MAIYRCRSIGTGCEPTLLVLVRYADVNLEGWVDGVDDWVSCWLGRVEDSNPAVPRA